MFLRKAGAHVIFNFLQDLLIISISFKIKINLSFLRSLFIKESIRSETTTANIFQIINPFNTW